MNKQLILLIVVMVIALIYAGGRQILPRKKLYIGFITVILATFSGLRSWWMGDLIKYYTLYRNCNGDVWRDFVFDRPENIGIRLFFHCMGTVGISYEVCIFLIAVFTAVTLGILIYRYSPSPYWSYVMYIAMGFYIFTFTGLKQTIAMGFLILAMMALIEEKRSRFLIWTIIGGLFHAPAVIFLAAYPFARKRIDWKYFALLAVCFILVLAFRNEIVSLLGELYYDEGEEFVASKVIGGRFMVMLLILLGGLFLRPLRNDDKLYRCTFTVMVLAAMLQSFSVYDNNFTRLADYYFQFVVLFIPLMLQPGEEQAFYEPERRHEIRYHPKELYIVACIGITIFSLWYYRQYIDGTWTILKDFKFIWQIDPYSLYGK